MRKRLHQCEQRITMDFIQILLLALYITQALTKSRSKKHKTSSSDEGSIENLLYYKDCQRSAKPEPSPPMPLMAPAPPPPPPPPRPECAFPKMCCALTCGNECGGSSPQPPHNMYQPAIDYQSFQSPPDQNSNPMSMSPGMTPVQPQVLRRKKRIRFQPNNVQPPMPMRRDMSGLTKDRIKGLIEQDSDIRKILKDLVRVTMQKVDLQDMLKSKQKNGFDGVSTARPIPPLVYEEDDYVE